MLLRYSKLTVILLSLSVRLAVIVPFFGDQHWWGEAVAKAGAGPSACVVALFSSPSHLI